MKFYAHSATQIVRGPSGGVTNIYGDWRSFDTAAERNDFCRTDRPGGDRRDPYVPIDPLDLCSPPYWKNHHHIGISDDEYASLLEKAK